MSKQNHNIMDTATVGAQRIGEEPRFELCRCTATLLYLLYYYPPFTPKVAGISTLFSQKLSRQPVASAWRLILLFASVTSALAGITYAPSSVAPPKPLREVRAAWIATVANIDWPSTNAVATGQQKGELLGILDKAAELKLNTLILQVRPACDAIYDSTLEPWSEYLTGTMGKAPDPYFDPLAFAVAEAHKRGLELHAWFNPYRARHLNARSPISPMHIAKAHPELVRQYGKYLWLDPGEKAVQDYSLKVVMDVVKRYDIDGVHFDDYFYPYLDSDSSGRDLQFQMRRVGSGMGPGAS